MSERHTPRAACCASRSHADTLTARRATFGAAPFAMGAGRPTTPATLPATGPASGQRRKWKTKVVAETSLSPPPGGSVLSAARAASPNKRPPSLSEMALPHKGGLQVFSGVVFPFVDCRRTQRSGGLGSWKQSETGLRRSLFRLLCAPVGRRTEAMAKQFRQPVFSRASPVKSSGHRAVPTGGSERTHLPWQHSTC